LYSFAEGEVPGLPPPAPTWLIRISIAIVGAAPIYNKIMNTKIDLKSALCGLAIGVLAMLVIAAAESSNPVGRYQVAGGAGSFTIVDTVTGQAWGASTASIQGAQAGFWDKK
jgi:hypothetical protein